MPRSLSATSLEKKGKRFVVFQGGTVVHRMEMAHQLASHLALKLYRVELRHFISRFIGETEKNLDKIFETVLAADTLLFFDEADAFFNPPPRARTSQDQATQSWMEHLLQRLKDYPGAAILATNSRSQPAKITRQLKPVVARIP